MMRYRFANPPAHAPREPRTHPTACRELLRCYGDLLLIGSSDRTQFGRCNSSMRPPLGSSTKAQGTSCPSTVDTPALTIVTPLLLSASTAASRFDTCSPIN